MLFSLNKVFFSVLSTPEHTERAGTRRTSLSDQATVKIFVLCENASEDSNPAVCPASTLPLSWMGPSGLAVSPPWPSTIFWLVAGRYNRRCLSCGV
ncbi:hypothetical protein CHARACLAT_008450 [Characodon lateralis]|uniref:Uncharacterized protein n=1 Tax=Characodon lateralis TaxID=208331 RepID=A0ABU7EL59_9TELE|nr:hypothetical protein [Characodon lateralis]